MGAHFSIMRWNTLTLLLLLLYSSQTLSNVVREPRFLSRLTNLMESLLPSFQTQLPEPQLFVELRRVKVLEDPPEDEISDHRRNFQDLHYNNNKINNDKVEVKKPVVSDLPKFSKAYKKNLRNKIKTLYKPKK